MMPPARKPDESELDYLRRKEVAFGLMQGEFLERIAELESDLNKAAKRVDSYRNALMLLHCSLFVCQRFAMLEADEIDADVFSKDFAPFKNVMAHHGVEPYSKLKKGKL